MLWTATMVCIATSCSIPAPYNNPAFSIYTTKQACERSIEARKMLRELNQDLDGIQWGCVSSETVKFLPDFGFIPQ